MAKEVIPTNLVNLNTDLGFCFVLCFEVGSLQFWLPENCYVDHAGLKLTDHLPASALSTGIKDMYHHTVLRNLLLKHLYIVIQNSNCCLNKAGTERAPEDTRVLELIAVQHIVYRFCGLSLTL